MKTVRVRVLVAVTDDGTYLAQGSTPFKGPFNAAAAEREMGEGIHNVMTPPIVYHWIEADVPVPAPTERKPIKATTRRKA
jgi:hypothetical protein